MSRNRKSKFISGKCKIGALAFVLTLGVSAGFAQALFQGLNFPVNSRSWGMGAATSSVNNDGSGMQFNPATISTTTTGWQINWTSFAADISSSTGYLTMSAPFGGNIALMSHLLNYGSFTERDEEGNEIGDFSANDFDLTVAYGRQMTRRFSLGVSSTYVRSVIGSLSANALLGSFGVMYYDRESTLSIGAGYHHFGAMLSGFNDQKERPPATLVLGISKKLAHLPMIISADVYRTNNEKIVGKVGGEFVFGERYFFRWGTSTRRFDLQARQTFTNFLAASSVGAGMVWRNFRFDLAVVSLGDAGTISSLSISQQLPNGSRK